MPTCDAPGPLASKNTRSPAWIAARSTCTPTLACWKLVRGSWIPTWAIAHWVRPEQSNEFGPTPPSAYGFPACVRAAATAPAAASDERAARDRPDDPVDLEPVRGLERRDRPLGLVPEDAVGGDP